jgi:hypothetical protein
MNQPSLDKNYWENRYQTQTTGWDIGFVSTPLKEFFDSLQNKNATILIPGCGRGYEAEYLFKKGFTNVYTSEIAPSAKNDFFERVPGFPDENWLQQDFFSIQKKFDLIIEQTFFCALHPDLREKYAIKMHELLAENGKLAGLLFKDDFKSENPPFGGDIEEYKNLFEKYFHILKMEDCYNSIEPRKGRELFILFQKNKSEPDRNSVFKKMLL